MATQVTIHVNVDSQDQPLNTSGVDFVQVDDVNDFLIITAGNATVADGQPIPSTNELNSAGLNISQSVEIIVDEYLLADFDENLLKDVQLMGDLDSRYVLAFDFDGATATEPVLELWDNLNLDTADNISLGAGVPSASWFRGIVTTNGSAGAPGWTGSRLAGSSTGNFLLLNDGAGELSAATTLYCQIKVIIPPSANQSGSETPIFAVKYTTN